MILKKTRRSKVSSTNTLSLPTSNIFCPKQITTQQLALRFDQFATQISADAAVAASGHSLDRPTLGLILPPLLSSESFARLMAAWPLTNPVETVVAASGHSLYPPLASPTIQLEAMVAASGHSLYPPLASPTEGFTSMISFPSRHFGQVIIRNIKTIFYIKFSASDLKTGLIRLWNNLEYFEF